MRGRRKQTRRRPARQAAGKTRPYGKLLLETLEDRRMLAAAEFDFGDAPAPYATTLADDGPRHELIGPMLGATADAEADGQPSTAADGDGADEDGVTFGEIRVGQLDASVTVNVRSAPAGAKLDAWIDFNGDGSWGGPGERIFANAPVINGDNALQFDVPSWATSGSTYARFRLSTEGGLGPSGLAADGEVEDYQIAIDSPVATSGLFGGQNRIGGALGRSPVFAVDVDGDGDLDVLSASSFDKINWYENDGNQRFTTRSVGTVARFLASIFVADVDGDGDIDVISTSSYLFGSEIRWHENDGSGRFTSHHIGTLPARAESVFAADMDGDGDIDVLSATNFQNDKMVWFENDGSERFTAHTISTNDDTNDLFAADVDGDGDIDVLSATGSGREGKIAWYENNGAEGFTAHTISTAVENAVSVFAADVDGDGDLDVLSASSYDDKIAWYENDGSEGFTAHTISTEVDKAHSVFAADMDGDGDIDVLSASTYDHKIVWYENDGSEDFTPHTIISEAGTGQGVLAADMDGDGDLDVLGLGAVLGSQTIVWYENFAGVDFGDAPTPYPTLLATAGAFHNAEGPTLGALRDDENDGQPTDGADGDGDDEDGVSFSEFMVGQLNASFTVNVRNAPVGAKLDAWIDFDGDGAWTAPSEHIAAGLSVQNGSNTILFDVPLTAAVGTTYVRFRLRTAGELAPTGPANDGEVEDYQVDILPIRPGDFGDAPAPYPTRLSDDGAFHHSGGPTLGDTRDVEDDAQPTAAADGDGDDEDGVTFGSIRVGQFDASVTVNVRNAPLGAKLDAWFDFNGDGTWGGPREQIFAGVRVANGNNILLFDVPSWTKPGNTYARFRLSTEGDLGVGGAAMDGEVEDYQLNVLSFETADFGDAPAPYPTRLSDDGALHLAVGPTLGQARDVENNGQPSDAADGDGGDEDGVAFGSIRVGQTAATVTVSVRSAPVGAKLDAWIDFNGDGSWGGPGEQIFDRVSLGNGSNALLFDVPSWAASGDTYARFRLSTEGDLGVRGATVDGEVEDYLLTIESPARASGLFSERDPISTDARGASSVFAADVDGDGDIDVLSASPLDDRIAWYENDGSGGFTSHTISASADGAVSVFAVDLDGDGDIDVLSASVLNSEIAWYENDGSENFRAHTISTFARGPWSVFAADVDGDGDIDVLSAAIGGNSIAWYENDGNAGFTAHTITATAENARSVFAADVDGDGDMDVLSASLIDNKIAWYENDGNESFTAHTISTSANGPEAVFAADVDGDGDMDVLSASIRGNTIAWYENDGNEGFTAHTISTEADNAQSVFAADLDGDGDIDVLSASSNDHTIAWYENDGGGGFTAHTISTAIVGPRSVFAADLDSDGDLDVLSASYSDNTIAWYENDAAVDFGDAPATYPTLSSANGASHAAGGPTLGALRDTEADGQPTAAADGDDDDGVIISAIIAGQNDASITVNVQNAPAGARLDAWIDFDGDGSWGREGEQIFDGVPVNNGDNNLLFDVPSWAVAGSTYARFRLSTAGDLQAGGWAADGEVEDYPLTINLPPPGSGVFSEENIISSSRFAGFNVFAADVDGDGDIDLLSSSVDDDEIAWYENDGSAGFTAHTISTDVDGASSVFALDLDGDGDVDVLSSSARGDNIAWYENDGSEGFTAHAISTSGSRSYFVLAADMDGDGDVDVLSADAERVAWYENDGNESFTTHIISTDISQARRVFAADVDGDGDLDVLSVSRRNDKIVWYENDGNAGFTAHAISTTADAPLSVFAADLDGDGDVDVLSASADDDTIAWYENDGSESFTVHAISTDAFFAKDVFAADVDGDGDLDVLSASARNHMIAWYENDGSEGFTAHRISTTAMSADRVLAADLDGDGDLDVISADDDKIAWYENLGSRLRGDLTGNGFVDFEDLTILLAAWNENVSAAEGNLVDADGTPVNFEDLTALLAAWTGPGAAGAPVGRRLAAAREVSTTEAAGFENDSDSEPEAPRQAAAYGARRTAARSRPAGGTYALRRLQAAAVDRALAEDAFETMLDRRSLRPRK